jgi:hypothetical protein
MNPTKRAKVSLDRAYVVDIEAASIIEFKNAFLSLYRKEKLYIDIKISRNLYRKDNFDKVLSKSGDQLQYYRTFYHGSSDGVYRFGEEVAIDRLKKVMLKAYNLFCEELNLVRISFSCLRVMLMNVYMRIYRHICIRCARAYSIGGL